MLRYTFCNAHNQGDLCLNGLDDGLSGTGRRNIDDTGLRPGSFFRLPHCPEHRFAQMLRSSFLGRHTTNNFGSIIQSLLGVESSLLSRKTLYNDFGFTSQN